MHINSYYEIITEDCVPYACINFEQHNFIMILILKVSTLYLNLSKFNKIINLGYLTITFIYII